MNGALGIIVLVLNRQTFVVEAEDGVHLLVHAVCDRMKPYVPAVYGYAMTIRRGQGTTLDVAGMHFDRGCADRGYGYVGASRVKRKQDLYLIGRVRRTDWRPVGGDIRGADHEQLHPSVLSETDDDMDRSSSEESSDSQHSQSDDEDMGAAYGRAFLRHANRDAADNDCNDYLDSSQSQQSLSDADGASGAGFARHANADAGELDDLDCFL